MIDTQDVTQAIKQLTIRPATEYDLPHIAHVAYVTWDATYSDTIDAENRRDFLNQAYRIERLATAIDANGHWFLVGDIGNQVVAFGHFMRRYHPSQGRAELVRFYVLPDYQNMGIGRAILKKGFSALAKANIQRCSVSVQATNIRARRLYERYGFVFHRRHGQFLGTQIITLAQYIREITSTDIL